MQLWTAPLITRLIDTNGDGVVTAVDAPTMVGIGFGRGTFSAAGNESDREFFSPVAGILRAWRGTTGSLEFRSGDRDALLGGDGVAEIVAIAWSSEPGFGPASSCAAV